MDAQIPIPIAIIGMSCRFPGGANNPDQLWERVLENGHSAWSDVPSTRYNWKSFYHPNQDASGAHNARGGHFLDQDISEFDANFFGIPATEANAIDPQQRLHLETAYEALENAGIPVENVRGSNTSVYIAVVSRDYDRNIYKDPSDIPKYHLTGCGDATACGRISYSFDLKGPSMTIDTGCSGSMVGLHLACQSLRSGESTMSIVGGVNLLLSPDMTIAMSMLHMLNDDGRCYSFDSRGSGYGRSEGVATVVLKRLDDALRDRDPVRAVIRNSGVNSDGRTNGILLPSLTSQESLIKSLFASTNLDPNTVDYVEAHGTGTVAGDSTELTSISNALCGIDRSTPLYVGSIKANIGHPESSSGLAGVIKACLAIERGLIPPVPDIEHFKQSLLLEDRNIKIPQKLEPWPTPGIRTACVNSFGFGGTNSHVILQSATPIELNGYNNAVEDERCHVDGSHSAKKTSNSHLHDFIANPPQLFVLSAKSKFSLLKMATNLGEWILKRKPHKDVCLRDLAFTLGSRRSLMSHRATFVASSADAFFDALQHPRVTKISANFRVSWLFTGQGAQWFEMARELLNTPIFGGSLSLSESILKRLGTSWSLIEELQKSEEDSRVNESEISQPATTAIQIGLVDLLRALNIFPQAVLGHSSGEIAAAYGAGVLSQESALKISYHRSFISAWCREDVRQKGAMLAVGLGEYGISKYISKLETGTAVIACANSPASTTISGDSLAIQELQEILNRLSIFNRRLKVDTAYHSHHMKAVADRYLRALGTIKTSPPDPAIKFFSSVTGVEKTSGFGASYWVDNLVSKVQFSDALQMLTVFQNADNLPTTFFLELGPHSALQGPVRQSLAPLNINLTKQLYFPTLVRDKNALVTILDLTGKLFEQGYPVNLQAVNTLESDISPNRPKVLYDLPSYAWNRERYWHESRISREYRLREHPYHDLLGLRNIGGNFLEPTWRNVLSIDALPWLNEHIIDKFALLPGSSFLCMAMEAMRQIIQDRKIAGIPKRFVMREVSFSKALVIPDSPGKIEVQLSFRQGGGTLDKNKTSWEEFCVTALTQDGKTWNEHCRGSIMVELTTPSEISLEDDFAHVEALNEERYSAMMAQERLRMMRKSCFHAIDSTSLYQELRKNGIDYGPTFASIRNLRIGHCEAVGTVIIPDVAACMPSSFMQPHIIHPATFDSLMHIVLPLYSRHCSPGPVMLTSIGEVTVSADIFSTPGQELLVACALSPTGTRSGTVDVSVFQGPDLESKAPVVTLSQEEFRGLGESHSIPRDYAAPRDSTYHAELINITDSLTPQKRQISSVRIIYNMSPFQKDLAHEISDTFTKLNLQVSCGTLKAQEFERGVTYLVIDSASQPLLIEPSPIHFRLINKMFQEADSVIWISIQDDKLSAANPEKDLIRGLARAARLKYNTLELATLDIQSEIQDMLHLIDTIMYISLEISKLSSPKDYDYIYNNGVLSIPRLIVDHAFDTYRATKDGKETTAIGLFHQIDRPLKIHIDTPGILESLVFVDDSAAQARLSDREVEIQVYAHAVNQTDVSVALGRSSSQMVGECAGVICAIGSGVPSIFQIGDRVCGWGASSSYGSRMKLDYRLIQKFPDSFSFAEGASIPFAFETAYYALIEVANLQKGQSILIHSAAGGVGQAAIMLAKNIGAEVFATVSSSSKRQMLIDKFGISKLNVFSSRTKSFRKAIIRATNGAGVDVVLNTLGENDMLLETWECIAKFGTFLNIGSISGQLPVKRFATSVTFSSINMSLMAQHQPAKVGRVLEIVMAMFRSKLLQPIQPITAIPITEITDAFRLIQHKRHSGKVVLTADDTTMVKQKKAQIPALRLNKTGKYLIVASDTTLLHDICQFMVVNGAEHLVLLLESHPQEAAFLSLIDSFDKKVEVQTCDITHRKKVVAAIAGLGNIKGVVQMSAFYPDDDPMTVNDYQVDGTRFLAEAALESSLDFFIMISPITHALGIGLNGGLSAGTAFQQAFAELQTNPETHYVSLSLGPISPKLSDLSAKQGDHYSQVDSEELYLLLEYVMSGAARSNGCHHLLAGLDKESLSQACPELLGDAIFNNLQEIETRGPSQTATSPKSIGQVLLDAESLQDARTIITVALAKQLSSLVALDVDDITLNLPISEIGLDSLIAIEFKNWIGRTLSAAMQTSEILDAANIQELAALITTRSTSVSKSLPDSSSTKDSPGSSAPSGPYSNKRPGFAQENDITVHSSDQSCLEQSSSSDHSTVPTPVSTTPSPLLKLPRQPLPDLESTLQLYLNSVRSFCLSAKELEHTRTVIEEFQQPGGLGTQLQERLLARYNDPNIQNWGAELYLASGFLERRVQLVPFSSFFFGHQLSHVPHSQAERAAVISTAAFEYKQLLDAGRIQSEILNEQPTCMELFQWIFNTSRKPCIGADVMEKFPGNDYLIAFKNGRAFKVLLRDEEKNIPFRELQAIFEVILDTVKENVSWEGILTADERNSWAKIREQIKEVGEGNREYLHTIEAACFVVCLDNSSPNTMVERAAQFHFGDGSNRWNDKSIQFVVCANGVSGFIGDHTMLDAGTVHGLNAHINAAILAHSPADHANVQDSIKCKHFEKVPFTMIPAIEDHIHRVREQFNESIASIEHSFFTYTDFGSSFLREQKSAPKSVFQMIVLLASQDFFGYVPALWETVSVSNFHQGRIEINQIVLPQVADFCAVFKNASVPVSVRRKLFFEAIKTHANSVTRASRGKGIDRHLSALRQVLRDDEPLPSLFKDPIYVKTRPRKIMSHCHETGMLEKGFVLRDPEAIWVHYELDDNEVRFAVTGTTGNTQNFCDLVQKNAALIKDLLTSE